MRILNHVNSPIMEDEDAVALTNLPLHSIFALVDACLQQTPVSQLGTNYPYKTYIDTLLSTSLQDYGVRYSQLFIKDTTDPDDADHIKGINTGLYLRSLYTKGGKIFDLEGPLHINSFNRNVSL